MIQAISAPALSDWLNDEAKKSPILLDVREPWEFETCQISGSQLMTMHTVPMRYQELDDEQEIVCICHHGARSMQVANYLQQQGFTKIFNLTGGIHAWSTQVDPSVPTY